MSRAKIILSSLIRIALVVFVSVGSPTYFEQLRAPSIATVASLALALVSAHADLILWAVTRNKLYAHHENLILFNPITIFAYCFFGGWRAIVIALLSLHIVSRPTLDRTLTLLIPALLAIMAIWPSTAIEPSGFNIGQAYLKFATIYNAPHKYVEYIFVALGFGLAALYYARKSTVAVTPSLILNVTMVFVLFFPYGSMTGVLLICTVATLSHTWVRYRVLATLGFAYYLFQDYTILHTDFTSQIHTYLNTKLLSSLADGTFTNFFYTHPQSILTFYALPSLVLLLAIGAVIAYYHDEIREIVDVRFVTCSIAIGSLIILALTRAQSNAKSPSATTKLTIDKQFRLHDQSFNLPRIGNFESSRYTLQPDAINLVPFNLALYTPYLNIRKSSTRYAPIVDFTSMTGADAIQSRDSKNQPQNGLAITQKSRNHIIKTLLAAADHDGQNVQKINGRSVVYIYAPNYFVPGYSETQKAQVVGKLHTFRSAEDMSRTWVKSIRSKDDVIALFPPTPKEFGTDKPMERDFKTAYQKVYAGYIAEILSFVRGQTEDLYIVALVPSFKYEVIDAKFLKKSGLFDRVIEFNSIEDVAKIQGRSE